MIIFTLQNVLIHNSFKCIRLEFLHLFQNIFITLDLDLNNTHI